MALVCVDEVDIVLCHIIGASPAPLLLRLLLEKSVHQIEVLRLEEVYQHLPPVVFTSVAQRS